MDELVDNLNEADVKVFYTFAGKLKRTLKDARKRLRERESDEE